ncbi:MAG: zinc ribbon domain-containing protein [Candidatus Omnitrophica bacterium]|nr:zinc ribbon domain-containing protein [Candidatus Omnitrophota bacterium]
MSKKEGRFRKLELSPLLKVFRKSSDDLKRFEHLEVDGHKIKLEITHKVDPDAKGFIACPQCQKKNPGNTLYCLYCSFIFNQAGDREVSDTGLQPYQILCPNCGRVGARAQRSCVYCGQVFTRDENEIPTGAGWQNHDLVDLNESPVITVTIDGREYRSNDPGLPADIKELMSRIRQEGYTREMVDDWARSRQIEKEYELQRARKNLQSAREQLWLRLLQIGVVIGFFVLLLLLASRR